MIHVGWLGFLPIAWLTAHLVAVEVRHDRSPHARAQHQRRFPSAADRKDTP